MWRIEGDEVVWTGSGPYRHAVGERAVLFWPGERMTLARARELEIPVDPARDRSRMEREEATER